jgi:hypothetical protein
VTIRTFIRTHRAEIDKHIRTRTERGSGMTLTIRYNDHDRELWVLNDESLYLWARSEGVRL